MSPFAALYGRSCKPPFCWIESGDRLVLGPFRILERNGPLAYMIDLPEKLAGVHHVFHVSHLRKYLHDPSLFVQPALLENLDVEPNLTVERKPLRIVDRGTKQLRGKSVSLVKV